MVTPLKPFVATAASVLLLVGCGGAAGQATPAVGVTPGSTLTEPSATTPAAGTPQVSTPAASTPAASSPAASTPAASPRAASSPAASPPAASSPAASPPAASSPAPTPSAGSPAPATSVPEGTATGSEEGASEEPTAAPGTPGEEKEVEPTAVPEEGEGDGADVPEEGAEPVPSPEPVTPTVRGRPAAAGVAAAIEAGALPNLGIKVKTARTLPYRKGLQLVAARVITPTGEGVATYLYTPLDAANPSSGGTVEPLNGIAQRWNQFPVPASDAAATNLAQRIIVP